MSVIYVLEDMAPRVEALRGWCPGDTIRHFESVRAFLGAVSGGVGGEPDLVILDHDLGGVPHTLTAGSLDHNGETGMDAAEQMREVDCPVIVWSVNPIRAPQMARVLQRRGMNAGWIPFGHSQLHSTIGKALASNV